MEDVFNKLPSIVWEKEHRRWSPVKLIRVRLSCILRYEEYGIDADQKKALETCLGKADRLSKVIYNKYSESSIDTTFMRTQHMVVAFTPEELDLKLQAE